MRQRVQHQPKDRVALRHVRRRKAAEQRPDQRRLLTARRVARSDRQKVERKVAHERRRRASCVCAKQRRKRLGWQPHRREIGRLEPLQHVLQHSHRFAPHRRGLREEGDETWEQRRGEHRLELGVVGDDDALVNAL